mmetsp:Transcript_41174/g.118997  ORF Transcript_41174/g.118997 Transcript_41174/m.118997 type:complete len:733 (-) Transcript_41174:582-2780(-)
MGSLFSSEDAEGPEPTTAYIRDIEKADAEQIEARWSRPNKPLPEYETALQCTCLQREWLTHTRILRYYRAMSQEFAADPWLPKLVSDGDYFAGVLLQLIRKGYGLSDVGAASQQCDVLSGANIFQTIRQLYSSGGRKRPYLAFSLQILLDMENADAISAKLSEVCDRAPRCASARQQALNLLVLHCYHLKHKPALDNGTLDSQDGALARFNECMEDYLDDHKERAFKSSFMEPARFYFSAVRDQSGLDHVNVHGLNWYLALLHAALGIQTPLLPVYEDEAPFGVVDFWAGLEEACWQHFSNPANFGSDFEGMPQLRRQKFVKQKVRHGTFPRGLWTRKPKELGNRAVDSQGDSATRKALAVYLERFMFFFSRDFFVRKAFETLNAEVKPEHAGWRKSCETLYQTYQKEYGASEDSLIEHCYRDDYYTDLDVERVHRFFAWLGVTRHPDVQSSINTFPFAHEATGTQDDADLQAAIAASLADQQWAAGEPAQGPSSSNAHAATTGQSDVSTMVKQDVDVDAEPWVLEASAQILSAFLEAASCEDPNQRASVFESWAMTEMIYGERPAGIRLLAKLVVEDAAFEASVGKALQQKHAWLRDAAGLIFRLHCMRVEGELEIEAAKGKALADAVNLIVEPFERKQPVRLVGHFYGALYTQALVAWLSARQSNKMETTALSRLVLRVGRAVVHCFTYFGSEPSLKRMIKERMHPEYKSLSPILYGSHEADIVWKNFFA